MPAAPANELLLAFRERVEDFHEKSKLHSPAAIGSIDAWQPRHPAFQLPQTLVDIYGAFNGCEIASVFELFPLEEIQDARKMPADDQELFFPDGPPSVEVWYVGHELNGNEFLLYYQDQKDFRLVTMTDEQSLGAELKDLLAFLERRCLPDRTNWECWSTDGTSEQTVTPRAYQARGVGRSLEECGSHDPGIQIAFKGLHLYASTDLDRPFLLGWNLHEVHGGRGTISVADLTKLVTARITQMVVVGDHLVLMVEGKNRMVLLVSHGEIHKMRTPNECGTGDVAPLHDFAERMPPFPSRFLTVCGNFAYFNVHAPDGMDELWRTDGTPPGTIQLHRFDKLAGIAPVFAHGAVRFFAGKSMRKKKKKKP